MTEYRCMTEDELSLWREAAAVVQKGTRRPCADCPMAYHLAEVAAGRCSVDRTPRSQRRLTQMREAQQRYRFRLASRARARDNVRGGRSAEPNSMAPDARLSATTREAGVAVSHEVVAR